MAVLWNGARMISDSEKKNLHEPSAKRRFFLFIRHSLSWMLGGVVLLWLSSFLIIGPVAESKISEQLGGAAYVQFGRVGFSSVKLRGIMIAETEEALRNRPVLQADAITVRFSPWRLLQGKFQIEDVTVEGLLVAADYDDEHKQWNLESFSFPSSSQPSGPTAIARVNIDGAMVQIRRGRGQQFVPLVAIGLDAQVRSGPQASEYSFSLAVDDRFDFGGSSLSGVLTAGREAEPTRLSVQGDILMSEPVYENIWNLEDIHVDCTFNAQRITVERCEFSLGDGRAELRGGLELGDEEQRQLDLNVNLEGFVLADTTAANAVVFGQLLKDAPDTVVGRFLRRFLRRFYPVGPVDVEMAIKGPLENLADADVNGRVACRGMSVLYEKFPYPIEQLTGEIVLDGHDLHIHKLSGLHDDVIINIDADILNLGGDREMDIVVSIPNMLFNDDLYNALSDSVKRVWYSFSPKGRAGIDYRYRKFADGQVDKSLTLEMLNASVTYEHFPYPLDNITGTVAVHPDYVLLDNLISRFDDGRTVFLKGQVRELGSGRPDFAIDVLADSIPVDKVLTRAMPARQRAILKRLDIDATANVNIEIKRGTSSEQPLDFLAELQIDGDHLVYHDCNVPMSNVHLLANITNDRVELKSFRAAVDGGTVELSGLLEPTGADPNKPAICLDMDIRRFDLNEIFWQAVDERADVLLGDFRPQGRINLNGHLSLNQSSEVCGASDITIQCSDNLILWNGRQLAKVNGALNIFGEMTFFQDFQVSEIVLESFPRALLPDTLLTVYDAAVPHGTLSIGIRDGFLKYNEQGLRGIDLNVDFEMDQIALGAEQKLHQLCGGASGSISAIPPSGYCLAMMDYDIDHFLWEHYLITDLRGRFDYDSKTGYFKSLNFTAGLYEGLITGDLETDFSNSERTDYQLLMSLEGVDVKQLLSAEYAQAKENVLEGLASGTLTLAGDLKNIQESSGKVSAQVENMKLGRQSIMGQVITAMQFRIPSSFVFDEIEVDGELYGTELSIDSLHLEGKPLAFWGSGRLDLASDEMEIDLVAFDRLLGSDKMILGQIARGIGKAIWKIELSGGVSEPEIDVIYFSVLKQPLNIFKKKQE
jgi:hypothetical protein